MAPTWLTVIAWIYMAMAVSCAAIMLFDTFSRHRQMMKVMEWVWPITALYLGPIALYGYFKWGRSYSMAYQMEHSLDGPNAPHWVKVGVSTMHCGAGCTLGDIVAEWVIFGFALQIAGHAVFASFIIDYAFAFAFGVVFQAWAVMGMGKASPGEIAKTALTSDLVSLTAFEVGLFVWMALFQLVFFSPALIPTNIVFWFMMQIGMIIGLGTSYPANMWLIKSGIKEAM